MRRRWRIAEQTGSVSVTAPDPIFTLCSPNVFITDTIILKVLPQISWGSVRRTDWQTRLYLNQSYGSDTSQQNPGNTKLRRECQSQLRGFWPCWCVPLCPMSFHRTFYQVSVTFMSTQTLYKEHLQAQSAEKLKNFWRQEQLCIWTGYAEH